MITDKEALDYIKAEMATKSPWKEKLEKQIQVDSEVEAKTKEIAEKWIPLREAEKDPEKKKQLAYDQNAELEIEIQKIKDSF